MGLGRDLGERAGSDCDSRREWSFPPRFAASLKGFSAGSRRSRRGWPSLSARTPPCGLKNADLKRRLGLDSSTSSKPPSSDGLRKKEAKPARTVRQGERGTARPQGRSAQEQAGTPSPTPPSYTWRPGGRDPHPLPTSLLPERRNVQGRRQQREQESLFVIVVRAPGGRPHTVPPSSSDRSCSSLSPAINVWSRSSWISDLA
jgi:hypothetical protein